MKDNKTYILGISAFYHDAAAALVRDGEIIAAAQEERFTRKKHDPSFPVKSVEYCLKEAGINIGDIDIVAFYDRPQRLFMKDYIRRTLGYKGTIIFFKRHCSHAASAFFPSPFNEAAILTVDGAGRGTTTSFGKGRGNKTELYCRIKFPHSLGLLYSAFTYYCGFKVNSGEYKLMGLAPYGEPRYVDIILGNLIDLKSDGSFRLNLKYFNYCTGLVTTNEKFHRLFGDPPRKPESKLEKKHMDLARSVQAVTEMAIMKMARRIHKETNMENLCLAGGVALNCVVNGKVLREGPFKNIWIQPASSDAGGALGAALIAWHEYLGKNRSAKGDKDGQKGSLLGPSFSDKEIEDYLVENDVPYMKIAQEEIINVVSDLLAGQKVIGWFQGRMEFGPRALGSRSILADPRSKNMQSVLNEKIKFREPFRPFAPTVLSEKAQEYFELDRESPYMLLAVPLRKEKRENVDINGRLKGLEKLKIARSKVSAVTHVDYSARVQAIKREDNPLFYDVIKKFYEDHGCPIVVNTSLNMKGEPIVCTPQEAYECFVATDMDYLVMGSFLIGKRSENMLFAKGEMKTCGYC